MTAWRMVARATGGAEVLTREAFDPPRPGPGELLVRHEAIGLNFIDIYYRSGLYPADLPLTPGSEGAGVVEAVGAGVAGIAVGQRVAYVVRALGSYATHRTIAADRAVPLPDDIASDVAAALLLKGQTVAALTGPCAGVRAGQSALVHAAAGGVGSIMVPWLADLGVTVIAHAGSPEKAALAKQAGAHHALDCGFDALAAEVRALTSGRGVDVAFDGVGAASWDASIAAIAPRGLMVSYGNASGPVPPVDLLRIGRAGSLFVTRPVLFDYADTVAEYRALADELFGRIRSGVVGAEIGGRFALADAAAAHRALEGRRTVGASVLIP